MNKIAIINGACGGIGFETAKSFLSNGYYTILLGKSQEKLDLVYDKLQFLGVANTLIQTFKVDMLQLNDIDSFANFLSKNHLYPNVIINASGVVEIGNLHKVTNNQWKSAIQINLLGVVHFITVMSEIMMANKKEGSIVFINGVLSRQPSADFVINSTITGAINNFAKSISKYLGGNNIRTNTINPGLTKTDLYNKIKSYISINTGLSLEEVEKNLLEQSPNKQFAEASDIADAVYFLCSKQAKHINGTFLTIDGGSSECY